MLQTSITKWLTKPKAVTQSSANSDAVPLQSQQANKRNNSTITNDISAPTLSPPPIPPPQPSNIIQNNGTISITAANLSTTPALTTLPALSPNITLAPLTAPTLASFRRLNTLLLEIPYPAKFYDEILTDPTTASITLAAFWHNTNAPDPGPKNPGILVAGIRCRLLSAACSPDLPPPAPTQQTTAPQPHLYIATLSTLSPYRHHGLAAQTSGPLTHFPSSLSLQPRQHSRVQISAMPIPIPSTEKPSNSETSVSENNTQNTTTTSSSTGAQPQQQPKSEAELAAEKLYEERIEEEYAKREGGA